VCYHRQTVATSSKKESTTSIFTFRNIKHQLLRRIEEDPKKKNPTATSL
jgi:hypothetical protein